MTARRKNTFKEFQTKKIKKRKQFLAEELTKLKVNHVRFDDITHLARHAAALVHQQELLEHHTLGTKKPDNIAPSTLLRNPEYRHLLSSYQTGNFDESGTLPVSKADIEYIRKRYPAINAYIGEKELEVSRFRSQLDKMRNKGAFDADDARSIDKHIVTSDGSNRDDEFKKRNDDLDKMVTALLRIIAKIEFLEIDYRNCTILDKSQLDKELVDKKILKPFFDRLNSAGRFMLEGSNE